MDVGVCIFMKMSLDTKNCVLYGGKIIMKSRRFLSDVKKLYGELFELHQFSDVQAEMQLHGKSDISRRSSYIKGIYDCMLGTGDAIINTWLTSNLSLSDIASIKGQNTNTLKSRKYYLDKMLDEHANYKDSNILFYAVTAEDISEAEWKELWKRLAYIKHKLYPDIIDRKQFLINIPAGEMDTEPPANFDKFIKVLEIYSVEHRKQVQKQVNEMKEAVGYFNYLNTYAASLSAEDTIYKERIMKIVNKPEYTNKDEDSKTEVLVPIIKDSNNPWIPTWGKYYNELTPEEKDLYEYKPHRSKI